MNLKTPFLRLRGGVLYYRDICNFTRVHVLSIYRRSRLERSSGQQSAISRALIVLVFVIYPHLYMNDVGASSGLISDFDINTKSGFISVSLGNALAV